MGMGPEEVLRRTREGYEAFRRAAEARAPLWDGFQLLVANELSRVTANPGGTAATRDEGAKNAWIGLAVTNLAGALGFSEEGLKLMWEGIRMVRMHEDRSGVRLHKGTEYNDLGVLMLNVGRIEEGLYNIQVAHEEDILTTKGSSALANVNLRTLAKGMTMPLFEMAEALAKRYGVRRISQQRAEVLLDGLDIESLGMLLIPLWHANESWDRASLGRMRRLSAIAGLTTFIEWRLRQAAASHRAKRLGVEGRTLGKLIDSLGKHTRRPWYGVYRAALDGTGRTRVKCPTGAETAKGATAALEAIEATTGLGAGQGRFAARTYLTAQMLRNFSHHTLEHGWEYLLDEKWKTIIAWMCAAVLQCEVDFRRQYIPKV